MSTTRRAVRPQPRPSRSQVRRARRRRARLRRTALLAITLASVVLLTIAVFRSGDDEPTENDAAPAVPTPAVVESSIAPPMSEAPLAPPEVVEKGDGKWTYAPGDGERHGKAGQLMRYRVAVEGGIEQDIEEFTAAVEGVFADERGWTAGKQWRLQRVGKGESHDFTVYLASPKTRTVLCASDDTFTSCRNGEKVVINLARWLLGIEDYGAGLDVYRQYVINHESGHALGHGHELCPKKGEQAPVMQQQTLGMHGCEANAWPYPDGKKYYSGPQGEY
ncbi:DUF3152 domain-containing protein [Phytomonospora endophytica]|uniref:DUF3152 domain-containing protein n=1 Tax=Phytomonospora endophytica TaxID=714109 RepID=A0A841FKH1_9ACTN|nr:DUF3152 domain-containing protein [Phytomonospora endophytica]MBB6033139.1 hypothetical protein [Phytomonospora endophytica]